MTIPLDQRSAQLQPALAKEADRRDIEGLLKVPLQRADAQPGGSGNRGKRMVGGGASGNQIPSPMDRMPSAAPSHGSSQLVPMPLVILVRQPGEKLENQGLGAKPPGLWPAPGTQHVMGERSGRGRDAGLLNAFPPIARWSEEGDAKALQRAGREMGGDGPAGRLGCGYRRHLDGLG